MKLAHLLLGKPIRKTLKVKAHAMTMAAAVWLFFSLIGLTFFIMGWLDHEFGLCALGGLALLIQALFVYYAVQYWKSEKAREVDFYETDASIE
jgi:hypothetical protein